MAFTALQMIETMMAVSVIDNICPLRTPSTAHRPQKPFWSSWSSTIGLGVQQFNWSPHQRSRQLRLRLRIWWNNLREVAEQGDAARQWLNRMQQQDVTRKVSEVALMGTDIDEDGTISIEISLHQCALYHINQMATWTLRSNILLIVLINGLQWQAT